MNPQDIFKSTLGELQVNLSSVAYKSFFAQTKVGVCKDNTVEVICSSDYVKEQITKKFFSLFEGTFNRIGNSDYKINLTVDKAEVKTHVNDLPLFNPKKDPKTTEEFVNPQLSPKYTFDTFIVGPSNRLAHAIATAISENPGKVYNPFFLHAGVGLGKTHLIQAIGHQILKTNPRAKIVYATAESFMNELIEAIQEGRNKNYSANKFRNKFRKADVLLIDDIQFIAGRGEATQEEFFHTFNALYMQEKQIVLTSDRPPRELSGLDVRITSRFASGVIADMQSPGAETRSAILREKRDMMKASITNDVVDYIAEIVETNIRELEGAFLQVITQARAEGVDVTKDFSARVLGQTIKKSEVQINDVLKTVCTYFSIKLPDLKGKSRIKEFVVPRQVSMYLLKTHTSLPYMSIGDLLGKRDHTTIMHGAEKIEKEILKNPKLKQDINNLKRTLNITM